jgi:glycosyltransferase involved in cell wall biosynthesis
MAEGGECMRQDVTIVIPTFNRGPRLAQTVGRLLLSRLDDIREVEIVVVDDGSALPAKDHLEGIRVAPPFALRAIRQENTGPGGARNMGFRASHGALVIFVDDDVLAEPDLVSRHLDAHRRYPGSVVFGPCALPENGEAPFRRFLGSLHPEAPAEPFTEVAFVASGHLSVERAQFEAEAAVYRDDLRVPSAEEFELSFRLRAKGIPIIMFHGVTALHDQPVDLATLRKQQRKYGMGIWEASLKCPHLTAMPEFAVLLAANAPPSRADSVGVAMRKLLKEAVRLGPIDGFAEQAVAMVERYFPHPVLLHSGYRALLGASMYAGLQDGRRQFGTASR